MLSSYVNIPIHSPRVLQGVLFLSKWNKIRERKGLGRDSSLISSKVTYKCRLWIANLGANIKKMDVTFSLFLAYIKTNCFYSGYTNLAVGRNIAMGFSCAKL